MDLHKMIVELESERDRLNQAILALERLSAGKAKKRGRPPKWLQPDRSDSSSHLPAEPVNTDLPEV
jgi:hypothetical protein